MARKLKVFRTPIGFHDAYVAAPSRKAALAAWGSDADLFARGMAEQVEDEALMREPLAQPGKVIRRLRGSDDDHFAELARQAPAVRKAAPKTPSETPPSETPPSEAPVRRRPATRKAKPPKRRPPPSRATLEAAEAALDRCRARQAEEASALRRREKALQEERRALERRHEQEIATLAAALDKARGRYRTALEKWQG